MPPEVRDGLDELSRADELDPADRDGAIAAARDRGLDSTARWLERVGPLVYERAAQGAYVAGDS